MGMGMGWAQGRDPLQLGPWGEAKQSPFLGAVWALYKAEGAENWESAPSAGMQVAWVQRHRLPPRQGWGQAQHALGTGIPPSQRTMSVILKDASWRLLPSICGAQKDRCATGKGQPGGCLPHSSPSSEHGDPPLPWQRDPRQKSITHKDNHHQKLCKIPLPPPSSGKVKFHAKAILLLFNYQPAPGTRSSPDRFSFVRLHKAREAGLRGGCAALGETWELATWAARAKAGATWC